MLKDKFKNYDVVLASQSPRRQELLKGLDLEYRIETRLVNEVYDNKLQKGEITAYLATLKAQAFQSDITNHQIVVTSDTIVWFENQALEKPKSRKQAFNMLQSMQGKSHLVYTSVCVLTSKGKHVITDETKVLFNKMTDQQIDYYIDHYKPFDKAGAYGIQDWWGYTAVKEIKGCYYNVMGLPLQALHRLLSDIALS
jgi:septum formation protein